MRKLLGYRLKEEKYRGAAESITGISKISDRVNFEKNSYAYDSVKQAGVMHWFEEVYEEEKLEVGRWYKWKDISMAYFKGVNVRTYGMNLSVNRWIESNNWFERCDNIDNFTLATTEEIQQALIKEATKRGFKNQTIIDLDGDEFKVDIEDPKYDYNNNFLELGLAIVFQDGKWAEILPTETLNGKTAIIDGVEYELKIKS